MRAATLEQALKHPNWSMGPKITIDSATMMNKGLELIEAHHLFAVEPAKLDVLVHPQSIIHGMVEYRDGSVVAQLGSPDMRIPIAHCLAWPSRIDGPAAKLDLAKIGYADLRGARPGSASRRWRSAAARSRPAARRRPSSTPPTRSRSPPSSTGRSASAASPTWWRPRLTRPSAASDRWNRKISTKRSAVDHMARSLAQDLLPEIAAKAF